MRGESREEAKRLGVVVRERERVYTKTKNDKKINQRKTKDSDEDSVCARGGVRDCPAKCMRT